MRSRGDNSGKYSTNRQFHTRRMPRLQESGYKRDKSRDILLRVSGKRETEVFVGIFGHAVHAQKYPGKLLALTLIWAYDETALRLACILEFVVFML